MKECLEDGMIYVDASALDEEVQSMLKAMSLI
jgi:hypothetical protein